MSTDDIRKELGAAITAARGKQSLGQLALRAGITKSALVRLEAGERQTLTLGLARAIAGAADDYPSRVFGRRLIRYAGRAGVRPPRTAGGIRKAAAAADVVPMEHLLLVLAALHAQAAAVDARGDEVGGGFGPMLEVAADLLLNGA